MSPELGVLKIASPCREKWSKMVGDDRVRFCGRCQLKVYDLTQMDADDARALLERYEGKRLCVRFYARRDGRVMTRDCRDGARLQARLNRFIAAGGVLAFVLLALCAFVTLFGDYVRRYFGMEAGGM